VRTRWVIVLILMAAMVVSMIDRFALAALLEPIRKDLHIPDSGLGLLGGVSFGLFYAFLGVPLGTLADRWSRTGTIMLGVSVWCLATAACGFATTFSMLLAVRIFVGAGEAALAPASYSLIHDIFPPTQLARAMSVFQLGAVLGAGVAFVTIGLIYAPLVDGAAASLPIVGSLQPWQQTFLVVALPGIVLLPLLTTIPEPARGIRVASQSSEPAQSAVPYSVEATTPPPAVADEPRGLAGAFATNPRFYLLLFTATSGILTVNYALLSWMPSVMVREFQRSVAGAGTIYGMLVLIASGAGLLFGGWLGDYLHARDRHAGYCWIPLVSSAIILPLVFALSWCDKWISLLVILSVTHFATGLPIGAVPALIQLRTPRSARSRVSSVYVLVINLFGLGVGPAIVGFLAQGTSRVGGLRVAVAELGTVCAIVAVCASVVLLVKSWRGTSAAGITAVPGL
jgi:MFS family permease